MSWVAVGASVAGAAAGSLLSGKGGGGTTTQNKNPWEAAVPWLQSNLATGQNLQNAYAQNPFNPIQTGAYNNLLAGNNYINNMVPGLLSQFSQPTGYDRNNPGRAAPIQMPAYSMAEYQPVAGGLLTPSLAGATQMGAANTAPAAANNLGMAGGAGGDPAQVNPYVGMVNRPGDLFNLASIYGGK